MKKHFIYFFIHFFSIASIFSQDRINNTIEPIFLLNNEEVLFVQSISSKWQDQIEFLNFQNQEKSEEFDIFEDNSLLEDQIKIIDKNTPFKFELTESTQIHINSLLKNKKNYLERILYRGTYFFPIIEESLRKYKLPLELKYLAVVESGLNPTAESHAGAVGIWQFMYQTGRLYNLNSNSYIDDRRNPFKSSEAAAHHLYDLFQIYNDWDLALAAYNAGTGNVNKAMTRANANDYWSIRKYLPTETQNYVPRFYATLYLFKRYEKEYKVKNNIFSVFNVDTIQVKKELNFDIIQKTLGLDIEILEQLNPMYYKFVIPENSFLVLPVEYALLYIKNEEKIFNSYQMKYGLKKIESSNVKENNELISEILVEKKDNKFVIHRVKKGENLFSISNKYNVSIGQIKEWNDLSSEIIHENNDLKIYNFKGKEKKVTERQSVKYHIVKRGESLIKLSQKYGIPIKHIKKINKLKDDKIYSGQKLKISEKK